MILSYLITPKIFNGNKLIIPYQYRDKEDNLVIQSATFNYGQKYKAWLFLHEYFPEPYLKIKNAKQEIILNLHQSQEYFEKF